MSIPCCGSPAVRGPTVAYKLVLNLPNGSQPVQTIASPIPFNLLLNGPVPANSSQQGINLTLSPFAPTYSNQTGIFTAPCAGLYQISPNVNITGLTANSFTVSIVVNGQPISSVASPAGQVVSRHVSWSEIVGLNAGDQVGIYIQASASGDTLISNTTTPYSTSVSINSLF